LTADLGGIRFILAFSDEQALARYAQERGEYRREWTYRTILGARLLDPVAEQWTAPVVEGREPVEFLGDVVPGCAGHGVPPLAGRRAADLLPPVLALPSDGPQSLISSPEEVAGQGGSAS
jgi:hypothetical protein